MKAHALCFFLLLLFSFSALAQSSSFTYQGKLNDAGIPANGQYDLSFTLYDTANSTTPVATTTIVENVQVTSGIFTVELSFDFTPFNTVAAQYIEIAVRPGTSTGAFTTLSPRQHLTSAPYAMQSAFSVFSNFSNNATNATSANNALAVGGTPAAQIVKEGDTRLTDARMPLPNSSNYIQNTVSAQTASNFNISGNGTVGGTFSGNVVNSLTQFNLGGSRILSNAGTDNLFVGVDAGQSNTSGFSNSFFGRAAGQTNTSGVNNTLFGASAGQSNSTGSNNSFFGRAAGFANSTGSGNSFFGGSAGESNTTASSNSFFGLSAGFATSTGGNNSFFGFRAGQSNSTGDNNVFVGFRAGDSNISGVNNAFLGASAGFSNLNGFDNSFIGGQAGLVNTTGTDNSFIGAGSGLANTTGLANTFVGSLSGTSNTTGGSNIAIGFNAGANLTTGSSNIVIGNTGVSGESNITRIGTTQSDAFIAGIIHGNGSGLTNLNIPSGNASYIQNQNAGPQASNFNISGTGAAAILNATTQYNFGGSAVIRQNTLPTKRNLFIGNSAGGASDLGGNTFVGVGAGEGNTQGNNSFFGVNSGRFSSLTSNSSFYGFRAGESTTGEANAFFGSAAGSTTSSGTNNSFFGTSAGANNQTGGSNTFIGFATGFSNTAGSGNVLIGASADLGSQALTNATAIGAKSSVTQNNSLVLGSINGVNGATADTNVGIGITSPQFRLHVSDASNTGLRVQTNTAGGTVASFGGNGAFLIDAPGVTGARFYVLEDGRVGIGISSTAPSPDKLAVAGSISFATLGSAGSTQLCRNASNQIATCSSSLRYKTNIGDFRSGLSFVRQLRPISFDWRDGGLKDIGFGAEDVAKIDPRFVTYNDNGEIEGVKYDRLSVAFVNAFKEQQFQIDEQKKHLESQAAQIEALKRIACSIKPDADICKAIN